MEGNQENKKKKNSSSMSFKYVSGAGGLAGIILLGGVVATAAVVSIFSYKKKHQSTSKKNDHLDLMNKSNVKEDHDDLVGDGLSFLVPDSLSPQCNNISNGTQSAMVSEQIMVLDETSKTNGEKNEEIDILEKARESHEFGTDKDKLLVLDADNLLLLKPEEMMKYDEEILISKFNEEIMTTDGVVDNDREIALNIEVGDKVCGGNGENIEGNNKYLADQLGVDGEEGMDVEETNEKQEVLEEFEKLGGVNDEYHMVRDECDENGERQVEAAVVNQMKVDDNSEKGGGECVDDAGLTIENCEEFVWEVVDANGIQGSKILEASTICGDDQSIRCCGGILINRSETETCDSKKGDNDLVEDHLVIVDLKIKGDEANDAAARKDEIKFANKGETQLLEANGEKRKDFKNYRENAENVCEEADENVVENEPCEEYLKKVVAENQEKYNFDSPSTEIVSTQTDGFKVQEFSFPVLDSPSLFKSGKSNKNDSLETALQAEDVNPNKKNSLNDNVFAYEIMLENKPLVQSAEIDEKKSCDDGSKNDVGKGEKKLETVLVDIAQKSELSEQCGPSVDRKIDEETFEIIHKENLEVKHNQHSSLKEDKYDNDNVSREEESDSTDCAEEDDESNKSDEEDTTDEVDESSETTADSSLDSNEEAIWPTVSMQEFSQVKDTQTNNQKLIGEDRYVKFNNHKLEEEEDKDSFEMKFSKQLTAENTTLEQPTNFFNLKVWFLPLMVPFLLLLWLFSYHISFLRSSQCHLE